MLNKSPLFILNIDNFFALESEFIGQDTLLSPCEYTTMYIGLYCNSLNTVVKVVSGISESSKAVTPPSSVSSKLVVGPSDGILPSEKLLSNGSASNDVKLPILLP